MLSKSKEWELRLAHRQEKYRYDLLVLTLKNEAKFRRDQLSDAEERAEHLDKLVSMLTTLEPNLLKKYGQDAPLHPGSVQQWDTAGMQQAINFRNDKAASDKYKGEVVK